MEIEQKLPPPRGEVDACERSENASGGGPPLTVGSAPHPARCRSPTSPQGGGDRADRILAIARSWIGTPYVHQASLKGVGCDCLGLLRGIWRELYGEEPEEIPPYSLDWAEATGAETLYTALERHCREVALPPFTGGVPPKAGRGAEFDALLPGDIALFRMLPRGPAKHCGIVGQRDLTSPNAAGGDVDRCLTLIHSRQNKRVSEEPFSAFWGDRLAFAFRLR